MIVCYYTEIKRPWANNELHQHASLIPKVIREKILLKKNHLDVQLSITGYLLLLKLIAHFNFNLSLENIIYNEYQRPEFNAEFDFNISHAGNLVICCATDKGRLGIDIEQIKPVTINYDDYFTSTEQSNILNAANPQTEFFRYWTRKEALLKAVGTGIYTPLLDMDVSTDEVAYKSVKYRLSPINVATGYEGYVACTVLQDISVDRVWL